jgi:hypothetical protein
MKRFIRSDFKMVDSVESFRNFKCWPEPPSRPRAKSGCTFTNVLNRERCYVCPELETVIPQIVHTQKVSVGHMHTETNAKEKSRHSAFRAEAALQKWNRSETQKRCDAQKLETNVGRQRRNVATSQRSNVVTSLNRFFEWWMCDVARRLGFAEWMVGYLPGLPDFSWCRIPK